MRNRLGFLLAVGVLMVSVPLWAHHGNAAYDYTKSHTVKGTVTEWLWANPHCWLKLDAKDDSGNTVHWVVEGSNPPDLTRMGWAKSSFKPGDQVAVTIIMPKNGQGSVGRFTGERAVVFSDGQVLSAGRRAGTAGDDSK